MISKSFIGVHRAPFASVTGLWLSGYFPLFASRSFGDFFRNMSYSAFGSGNCRQRDPVFGPRFWPILCFFGNFSCCNLIGFLPDFSKRTKTVSEPSTGKSIILDRFGASFWWLHVTHVGCWINYYQVEVVKTIPKGTTPPK